MAVKAQLLTRACDVRPEALRFVWLDRVPRGKFTLVAGRPGTSKSLFSAFLAGEVTNAGGAVILSNPEDGKADVQVPRLIAAGANNRLVHFWPGSVRVPEDVPELEALVRFHRVELVVLDPIALHIRGTDTRQAMGPLIEMAERTDCAVLGIHHMRKTIARNAHPQEAIGGEAGGFLGAARFVYALGPIASGDTDTRILAPVKSNLARLNFSLEFEIDTVEVDLPDGTIAEIGRMNLISRRSKVGAGAVVGYNGGGGRDGAESQDAKATAAEFLTLLLMHGARKATEVREEGVKVGVSWASIRRASDDLELVKHRVGFGPGSHVTWALPPGHPALGLTARVTGLAGTDETKVDIDELLAAILAPGNGDAEADSG